MPDYPVERELDGVYFHVERNGSFKNICFSDLTADEQRAVISKYDTNDSVYIWLIAYGESETPWIFMPNKGPGCLSTLPKITPSEPATHRITAISQRTS